MQQTLSSHPEILNAQSLQSAANSDIGIEKGGYLPHLNVTGGIGKENTDNPATRAAGDGDVTLTRKESDFLLSQLLFDGGNVLNRVAKSKADYQTATFQYYQTKELLAFAAAQAYLAVIRDRALLKVARLNVQAHEDMYVKISKRVVAGAGMRSDQELAQSRLALAKANYTLAEGHLADSEATYIKVVGSASPPLMPLPPQPRNVPFSLPLAQQLAVKLSPTLSASKSQIASNAAAVGVAKSAYFPTFTVDLNASYSDSLDGVPGYNNQKRAMLRMNYNVFNGGSDKSAVSAARYREVASQQDAQRVQREIFENVAFAWDAMQTSTKRVPNLERHMLESYNVWQAYIKQFQLGQRTMFDLLNSQSEYYDAKSSLIQAQFDERVSRYQLLAAIGELVSTVNSGNFYQLPAYTATAKTMIKPNGDIIGKPVTASPENTPPTSPPPANNAWTYPAPSTTPATPGAANPTPASPAVAPIVRPGSTNNAAAVSPATTPAVSNSTPTSPATTPAAASPAPVASSAIVAPVTRPTNSTAVQPTAPVQTAPMPAPVQKNSTPTAPSQTAPASTANPAATNTVDNWQPLAPMANNKQVAKSAAAPTATQHAIAPAKTVASAKPVTHTKVKTATKKSHATYEAWEAKHSAITTIEASTVQQSPPNLYQIQLLAASKRQTVEAYARKHHLSSETSIYEKRLQDKQVYALVYGNYPTRAAAKHALLSLKHKAPDVKPFIVSII
jgi:adhesin transport system outer membrane protein